MAGFDKEISVSVEAGKRRYRTREERRGIAEESLRPGVSVAVIARAHGVNANQVFHWRKQLREGLLELGQAPAQLMPVSIAEDHPARRTCTGSIHIEFGRTRIHIEGSVDPDNLRMILEHFNR